MARKTKGSVNRSGNKSGKGKARSAISGRYVTRSAHLVAPRTTIKESRRGATQDAGEFADRFMERYPNTFHELSKR